MAMLQFKMGQWTNQFDSMAKVPGTVYVTTNEQAMYVDVDESTRIRLGDIIQVDTVNKLRDMAPKYSRTALYYVIDENALLKYTGDGSVHTWKQINSVSDIQASVEGIQEDLDQAERDIIALKQELDGKEGVEGLKDRVSAVETAIEGDNGLEARMTTAEGAIDAVEKDIVEINAEIGADNEADTVKGRIKVLETDLGTAKGNIVTLTNTVGDSTKGLVKGQADLEGRMATAEGKITQAEKDIDAVEKEVDDVVAAIGTDSTEGTVKARIKNLETDLGETKGNLSTLTTTVGNSTSGLVKEVAEVKTKANNTSDLLGTINDTKTDATAFGKIAGLRGELDTAKGNITTLETAVNTTIPSELNTIKGNIITNKNDISALKTAVGEGATGLAGKVDALETWKETANTDITTAKSNISTLQTGLNDLVKENGVIDGLEDDIAQNRSDITTISGVVGDANGGLVKGQADLATAVSNLQKKDEEIVSAANNLKGRVDGIDTAIGSDEVTTSIKGRLKLVEDKAAGNLSDIITLKADKNTEGSVDYKVDQAEQRLNDKIAADINAANAMDYKGGVAAKSELPTTGVKIGDTYVLTQTSADGHAGDLLIAAKKEGVEEGADGFLPANGVTWNHVNTGYDASLVPQLGTNGNKITLTTFDGQDAKGHVEFVAAANSSATVEVTANKVTIGMEWGTF